MDVLLHPAYFPNVATFAAIAQYNITWEVYDNFQKQTYRNRCYIATDTGRHMLNIPIKHVGKNEGRQKYKEVKIDNSYRWQRQHWRTLETAYRTSPYFEFYEDDLKPLFDESYKYLLDFNLNTINIICDCLQIKMSKNTTNTYQKNILDNMVDGRFLVIAKSSIDFNQALYNHVFEERHGFLKNLSILDLLFNEGTNTLNYLKNQPLDFFNA